MFSRNLLFVLFLYLPLCFVFEESFSQCNGVNNLNNWAVQGPIAHGNWVISGTSVSQTLNNRPTFFVGPQNFLNARIRASFRTTSTDNDWLGFALGYQGPNGVVPGGVYPLETYLFEWSKNPTNVGTTGRILYDIDGNFTSGQMATQFPARGNKPGMTELAFEPVGWLANTLYNFEFTYLHDRIIVCVDNDTVFDVAGCYQPGRFGFFCHSQDQTTFSNFSYELIPRFSGPSITCTGASTSFTTTPLPTCATTVNSPSVAITNWNWNFGDGGTSTAQNPNHVYTTTGTYLVQLTVTNASGCTGTTTQSIIVNGVAAPTIANNGPLCSGNPLNLSSNTPVSGAGYSWTGPNGFTSTLPNPSIASAQAANSGTYILTLSNNGCFSTPISSNVVVTQTPTPPTLSTNSPVCASTALSLNASSAGAGINYLWNGPNGFSNSQQSTTITNATAAAAGTYSLTANNNGCISNSSSVNVQVNPLPVISTSPNTSTCLGNPVVLNASGANSYTWSNGTTTANNTVSPTSSTTYTVVGTSTLGCASLSDSVVVTVLSLPTVSIGPDSSYCDQVVLDAGALPTGYTWSDGSMGQTITANTTGTYSVQVANADGCFASDSINLVIHNTVLVDLGNDLDLCPDSSTLLQTNPLSYPSYNWSSGSTNPSLSVTQAGNYFVDVLDVNGCPSSDSILVQVWPELQGDLGTDTLICSGDSILLDASSWAGANYLWMPGGATTSTLPVGSTDTFVVQIGDGNGCIYRDTFNLTVDLPPLVSLTASNTVECVGDTLVFTASPGGLANYSFSVGGIVQQSSTATSWITTSLQQGDSVMLFATTVGGCPSNTIANSNVLILPRPDATIIADTACNGSPTTLIALLNSNSSLSWIGSGGLFGTTDSIVWSYPTPGAFPYTLTLDNGSCETILSGQVAVRPVPNAPVGPDVQACEGQSAGLTVSSGQGFVEWFDTPQMVGNAIQSGNNLSLSQVNATDSFWVHASLNGCISPQTQLILSVFPNPISDFISNPDTTTRFDVSRADIQFMNLSSGGTDYLWDFGDGNTSTDPNPLYSYTETGNYIVTLITRTAAGCADTSRIGPYEITGDRGDWFIPNTFTPNGDGDNDTWVIDVLAYYPNNTMTIANRWGTIVFEAKGYLDQWGGNWNGKPLPEGTYYYFLDPGDGLLPLKGFVMIVR